LKGRGIYVAGGGMNAGKTTLSLGLVSWLEENPPGSVSFMKPLGQKTRLTGGESVAEDTFLVNSSLGLDIPQDYTAPFAMSSGISKQFLREGKPSDIPRRIRRAYRYLSRNSRTVVVEGTGHPGVGSVFDLSNADVARMLNIPVLMVLDGGIGRTIDRYVLCSSLFHRAGIPILGVVINRVLKGKMEGVKEYLDPWFRSRGVPVYGYIPYVSSLCSPSLGMLGRELGFQEMLAERENVQDERVAGFVSGFGSTDEIMGALLAAPSSALILSATRPEVLDAVIARRVSGELEKGPGAVILCGPEIGAGSHAAAACDNLNIPLFRTARSAEASVSILRGRIFKVEPGESVKISEIIRTVKEHVDIKALMDRLHESPETGREERPGGIRGFFRKILGRT